MRLGHPLVHLVEATDGPRSNLVHLLRDSQGTHDALEMARGIIQLSSREQASAPRRRDAHAITPRQLEVLNLLSEGKGVKEIGKELYLSEATIRNHVRDLFQVLDAHSQLEMLAKARKPYGAIPPPLGSEFPPTWEELTLPNPRCLVALLSRLLEYQMATQTSSTTAPLEEQRGGCGHGSPS